MLEVIATSLNDALTAQKCGADRLEIVSHPEHGGLTPDLEVVREICQAVNLPLAIMIRPHPHHFFYDDDDIQTMARDIYQFSMLGVESIVSGVLDKNGNIAQQKLEELLKASTPCNFVFHRAIEQTPEILTSIEKLSSYPIIRRVLTNYMIKDFHGELDKLNSLINSTEQLGITTVLGGGINEETLDFLHQNSAVKAFHVGSAVRVNGSWDENIDPEKLTRLVSILDKNKAHDIA